MTYLGLRKSVSAKRGNHAGLTKPGQLSQVKRIQLKTKYPDSRAVMPLSIRSRPLPFSNCLTYPEIGMLSKFDLTDFLSQEFIWCISMSDKMFYHPSKKRNCEIAIKSKAGSTFKI